MSVRALDAYLESQRARGLARESLRLYRFYLGDFADHLRREQHAQMSAAAVESYLISLERRGAGDWCRHNAFKIIRRALRWARDHRFIEADPCELLRTPIVRDRPKVFGLKPEVKKLLAAVRGSGRMHAERDYAAFATMFYAAMRIGETLRLRAVDVDLSRGCLMVLGKGHRARELPVHHELVPILRAWLKRRPRGTPWLFPAQARHSPRLGQLDPTALQRPLRQIYRKLSRSTIQWTPHVLRRSMATRMRRRGAPVDVIRLLLGHRRIETTLTYIQETPEEIRTWTDRA